MIHRHHVLMVDDDLDTLEALSEFVRHEGFEVGTAVDGADALAQLRDGLKPCVILLDFRMPVMDGWKLRETLMHDPELARIPVVMFSGESVDAERARRLAIREYLRKPIDFDQLSATLRRHCGAAPIASRA